MERADVIKIIRVIASTYQQNFKADNLTELTDSWYFFLQDYDYNTIALALKTYVSTSGSAFPPNVSQLIAMTRKPAEATALTELEAWTLVRKAINNSNYHSEEEYDKLPDLVKKVITPAQLREWAITDEDSIESVVASNFQRSYRSIQKREADYNALPLEIRANLTSILGGQNGRGNNLLTD